VYLQKISHPMALSNAHFRRLRNPGDSITPQVLGAVAKLERTLIAQRNAAALVTSGDPLRASGKSDHRNQLTQPQTKGDQTDAATAFCPTASAIAPKRGPAPLLASPSPAPNWHRLYHAPDRGTDVQARAPRFRLRDLGRHNLKRGALTTGFEFGVRRTKPVGPCRHKEL
jgi:hypothetical protein